MIMGECLHVQKKIELNNWGWGKKINGEQKFNSGELLSRHQAKFDPISTEFHNEVIYSDSIPFSINFENDFLNSTIRHILWLGTLFIQFDMISFRFAKEKCFCEQEELKNYFKRYRKIHSVSHWSE